MMQEGGPDGRTPAGLREDPLIRNLRELRRLVHLRLRPPQTQIQAPMFDVRSQVQASATSFATHAVDAPPPGVREPMPEVTSQSTEQHEERTSGGFLPRLFRALAFRRSR